MLPKRANQLAGHKFWVKHADRNLWHQIIALLTANKKPRAPLTWAMITAIRYSSAQPDYDGLVSSFKYPIDALIEAGIIADDKFDVIGMPIFRWIKAPRKQGFIELTVEDLHDKENLIQIQKQRERLGKNE